MPIFNFNFKFYFPFFFKFLSDDCWLEVFEFLTPSQLGLGIALISHRFHYLVGVHFKTRKWALKFMRICSEIGENGTEKMKIANCHGEPLPIAQILLPRNVIGFGQIFITFIDRNVIAFLHRFCSPFPIKLSIKPTNDHILEFMFRNIWPLFAKNICGLRLSFKCFRRLRQLAPSILNDDCPTLRVNFTRKKAYPSFDNPILCCSANDFFTEFPADDSAAASDGHAVAKWLFTPRPDDVPKVFQCWLYTDHPNLAPKLEAFKSAFASASSFANFIISIWFPPLFADSVEPFDLTNGFTHEQLALKRINNSRRFLLIRCPIARDESKWTKWENEAIEWESDDQRNQIYIAIYREDQIGDGLLNSAPGPRIIVDVLIKLLFVVGLIKWIVLCIVCLLNSAPDPSDQQQK
ncbi:hypothetical protein niasHT_031345 [Heterodera trifolii]|uniref:F-box domain-containing protein n=1 Tax=Heterodera trifolii TaxID=157864 RepID=A0ABD2IRK4_9BILA